MSVQRYVVASNYLLLRIFNRFINSVTDVMPRVMYCLVLPMFHTTFISHQDKEKNNSEPIQEQTNE